MLDASGLTKMTPWGNSDWLPSVDVSESEDSVTVEAEVPGMSKDDLDIFIVQDVLTIKGERRQEKETKQKNYHSRERSYGSFSRSISLPTAVDTSKAKASFQDGLLTIELPKDDSVKPKRVSLEVEVAHKSD
jgi:HSP20 family protein